MRYVFEKVDSVVKISPMSTLFCKRIMDRLRKEIGRIILPDQCYQNAVVVSSWLAEMGFDVEIVEGEFKTDTGKTIEHRFCRKGGKYFDPTIELLYGFVSTASVEYKAIRVYDIDVIVDFTAQTLNDYGQVHFHSSITGLSYVYKGDEDIPLVWNYIDDNGEIVKPEYNPFERRLELLRV